MPSNNGYCTRTHLNWVVPPHYLSLVARAELEHFRATVGYPLGVPPGYLHLGWGCAPHPHRHLPSPHHLHNQIQISVLSMQVFIRQDFSDRVGGVRVLGKRQEGRLVPGKGGLLLYSSTSSCTKANSIRILLGQKYSININRLL